MLHQYKVLVIDINFSQKNEFFETLLKYYEFISQKSVNSETGEIWFTHVRLRSAAFNLGKLILNKTLFNFLNNCKVKSMNNVLVGGINSL